MTAATTPTTVIATRTGRAHRRVVIAALTLLATVITLGTATVAAQDTPAPDTVITDVVDPVTVPPCQGWWCTNPGDPEPGTDTPTTDCDAYVELLDGADENPDLARQLLAAEITGLPTSCDVIPNLDGGLYGNTYGYDRYEMNYSTRGVGLSSATRHAQGWPLTGGWIILQMLTLASTTVIAWTIDFHLFTVFSDTAAEFATELDTLLTELAVIPIGWSILGFVFAYRTLRGRLADGAATLATSIIAFAIVTAVVVNHPDGYAGLPTDTLDVSSTVAAELAIKIADPAHDDGATTHCGDNPTAGCAITVTLTEALIAVPYDIANWGQPLGRADDPNNPHQACAGTRNRILTEGPFHTSNEPRNWMADTPGCHDFANFNDNPSLKRSGYVAAFIAIAIITLVVFIAIAYNLMLASIRLLVAIVIAAALVFAAIVPLRPVRRLAAIWFASIASAALDLIALTALIASFTLITRTSHTVLVGEPFVIIAGFQTAIAITYWIWRKRLIARTATITDHAAAAITPRPITPPVRPSPIAVAARETRADYHRAKTAAKAATATRQRARTVANKLRISR